MELLLGMAAALWVAYQAGTRRPPAYPDLRKRAATLEAENADVRNRAAAGRVQVLDMRERLKGIQALNEVVHRKLRQRREAALRRSGLPPDLGGNARSLVNQSADVQARISRLLAETDPG